MLKIIKNNIFSMKTFLLMFTLLFSSMANAQEITAIDFNGEILGKVIPDGKVISLDDQIIGNVNVDSLIVDEKGVLIGGIVPQGIAIGNDNKVLGKVNNDGTVRLSSGKVAGKVLPNGLVVSDEYEIIGAVLFPGLIYSDAGKAVGRLTGDGNYTNLDGKIIGFISPDGFAYKKSGDTFVIDGKLISSKMVISQEGKFIGSVALGGRVTDFDSNVIGNIHANGYAYDDEDRIIGKIVKNGYAVSNNGEYLGFVSYNGDVVNQNVVVGHMRFDEKIVDDNQKVIGFFVDIAASATDMFGRYIGRIMPNGKIIKAKEEIGLISSRGNIVNQQGKIIGKISNTGPVFDYRGQLIAHALKNGQVITLEGSPLGRIVGNKVVSSTGRVVGATFYNLLIVDKNNKSLGMNGVSGSLSGIDKSYVSPLGYVYSSDGMLAGNAVRPDAVYDVYGETFGYLSPNAEVLNDEYTKLAGITQFGYAQDDAKQIKGGIIDVDYAINLSGDVFGNLAENNLIFDNNKKTIAKILPDLSIIEATDGSDKNLEPKRGTAFAEKIVINKEGVLLGYTNEAAEVYDFENMLIGKVADRGFVLDATGALIGEVVQYGGIVDENCGTVGVVTPRGDVRNYRDSLIGKLLQNGQVVSQGDAVVGYRVRTNMLIGRNGDIFATPSADGRAISLDNAKIGCIDIRGFYRDGDGKIMASTLGYYPVMGYDGRIIGRSVFNGNVVGEKEGRVAIDDSVVDEKGEPFGHLFKYKYAFDNNNNYLGRVLESGRVISNNNEDVGRVNFEGYVINKNEKVGYAAYDLYVYSQEGKAIGYFDKNGIIKNFSGSKIGDLNKGFVLNSAGKLIGRINRDYWVKNSKNKVVGELGINGKLYSIDNEVLGTLSKEGRIKDSKGNVLATPYPLQYYIAAPKKASKTKAPEPEEEDYEDVDEYSLEVIGIALTPDGDYLGDIMSNGDVLSRDGVLIGHRNSDGTIEDLDGNLIGIEDKGEKAGQEIFMPQNTFGPGGAYGVGAGVGNLGPGGGYGPGERYNAQRAAALQAAQEQRRQAINVKKISSTINPSTFDGYQKDWGDKVEKEISTYRVDMSTMILSDKPIPAVLSRSIDSSNPTPVTAYVERNVYAEEGRNIVIPAGSRLIGEIGSMGSDGNEEVISSATKVNITWKRLIRPDGIMFMFEGITGDAQGRGGALGYLDRQLLKRYGDEIMTTSVVSAIDIVMAPNKDNNGQTESPRQQAANDARENFTNSMQKIFEQMMEDQLGIKPLVYVPAGTRIIVYPNKDLWLVTAENADEVEAGRRDKEIPQTLIDDDDLKKRKSADEMAGNGGGDVAGKVVYSEDMPTDVKSQNGGMSLISSSDTNSGKNTQAGSAGGIPPVTVDSAGSLPPPPPSYSSSGSSSSSSNKSSNKDSSSGVPQLF